MANVPVYVLERFRERLLAIKYAEVHLWSDEDLKMAIFENGPSWINLLKWLLGELDNEIKIKLGSVAMEELVNSIKDVIIGLGLCSSTTAHRFVAGKVNVKEREEFCSYVMDLIELMRKESTIGTSSVNFTEIDEKFRSLMDFKVFKSFDESRRVKGKKRNDTRSANASTSDSLDSLIGIKTKLQENITAAEESIEKKRLQLELKDDNVTASEHLVQLFEEREMKLERLAQVSLSVQNLWESMNELYKSELEPLLPVEVMDPIKIPALEELSEKVDHFIKFQKDQETVARCRNILQDRYASSHDGDWSVRNTESLPLVDLQEQVHSVIMSQQLANQQFPSNK